MEHGGAPSVDSAGRFVNMCGPMCASFRNPDPGEPAGPLTPKQRQALTDLATVKTAGVAASSTGWRRGALVINYRTAVALFERGLVTGAGPREITLSDRGRRFSESQQATRTRRLGPGPTRASQIQSQGSRDQGPNDQLAGPAPSESQRRDDATLTAATKELARSTKAVVEWRETSRRLRNVAAGFEVSPAELRFVEAEVEASELRLVEALQRLDRLRAEER